VNFPIPPEISSGSVTESVTQSIEIARRAVEDLRSARATYVSARKWLFGRFWISCDVEAAPA
jgi:hypothetical protein